MDDLSTDRLRCRELFRSWITGDDVGRWEAEGATRFIIFIPKGWTREKYGSGTEEELWVQFERDYGSVANWLFQSKGALKSRSDKGDFWWELRACDYYDKFESELILYPEMSQGPKFCRKRGAAITNNKTFMLDTLRYDILAYLNSRAAWFLLSGICTSLRGGKWRLELRADYCNCSRPFGHAGIGRGFAARVNRMASRARRERRRAVSTTERMSA